MPGARVVVRSLVGIDRREVERIWARMARVWQELGPVAIDGHLPGCDRRYTTDSRGQVVIRMDPEPAGMPSAAYVRRGFLLAAETRTEPLRGPFANQAHGQLPVIE